MLRAQVTLYTLLLMNDQLFSELVVPERPFTARGYQDLYLPGWDIDVNTLLDNLLMETAELSVLYTDPEFMQAAIGAWSEKELPVWQELYETLFYKYNPIWNKDGTFKHNDTETRNLLNGLTRTVTSSGSQNDTTGDHTEYKVSAYDQSSTYSPRDDTNTTGSLARTTSGSESTTDSGSNTGTVAHVTTDEEYGNIGVTMTQAMIEQQRQIVQFNIYDHIIESFKKRFCVLVY